MHRSRTARGLVAGTSVALLGGLMAGGATAQAPGTTERALEVRGDDAGVAVHTVRNDTARGERATNRYWTAERMRNARPAAAEISAGDLERRLPMPASERIAPGSVGTPSTGAADERGERKGRIRVGRMFYKFKKQNWTCSGAVLNTKRKNLVFTAAHCLWDKRKGWARKVIFIPGYHKGKSPFGRWHGKKLVIPKRFQHKFGGRKEGIWFDYGIMRVGRKGGPKIAKRVGGYGLQWGKGNRRKMRATGYPAFNTPGGVQKSCRGRTHKSRKYSWRGHKILTMKCRAVTAGSSGGPWLHRGYINGQNAGVNSFKKPRRIFTPWFGRGVKRIYKAMA